MNNVLKKNIENIKSNHQELKHTLNDYNYNIKPILATTNGYNLNYNGIYLHSSENPLAEARNIFNNVKNEETHTHIIYGLGLGYLFQIAAQESKGTVILYEPNMDILCEAFTLVDFSNELSKENVHLFTEFSDIIDFISKSTDYKSDVDILSLPSYREMYSAQFEKHAGMLQQAFGSVILDYGFKRSQLYKVTMNTLKNIPQLIKETPINNFENLYKGETAIIVSAGPTLYENIENLKKYQNNAVIFAVGPAMKTLIKNNINVDFLSIIESNNCSKQVEGLDLTNINLIMEPYTHSSIHNLEVKNKLLHVSENMPASQYFANLTDVNTTGYNTQGTVSFLALNTAVKMGFSKIILVGQDLAYIDGQCYSKDSVYDELICQFNPTLKKYELVAKDFEKYSWAISASKDEEKRKETAAKRLLSLNSSLYTVKGIDGNMIPTEAGYASFIVHFEEYARQLSDIQLINTSLKGAQIDGFENISLDVAMKDSKPIEKKELNTEYNYNIHGLIEKLEDENNKLIKFIDIVNESGKQASRLTMDIKRDKTVTKDKLLKIRKLLENYYELNNENNVLLLYTTTEEEMEFNDIFSTIKNYDEKTFPVAASALKKYFEGINIKLSKVKKRLDNVIDKVKQA